MTLFSRRHALCAGVAGVAAAMTIKVQSGAVAQTAPAQLLKAVVTLAGVQYEFREEKGQALGDFVSTIGDFTQACTRTEVAGCPLSVYFRPDRNSDRIEVVFELGRIFNAVPVNLGAYTVTISRGGVAITTIDVPAHYWFARWRWQSAPRPIVGDIEALITGNLLPPFDRDGALASVATTTSSITEGGTSAIVCAPASPPAVTPAPADQLPATTLKMVPYSVMGLAGIVAYMPQTGERPDIGIVTEAQAEYICTSRQTALDLMRAQAEAGGSMPWHMRDENTGGPIDLRKYSGATWYSSTAQGAPYVKTIKGAVSVDSAHQPALAYVPYLLTGDPYHLEDLQFQANWNIGSLVPQYRMSIPQPRTFSWNLRTLAQCARMTPAQVPSWLLPRQYWTDFLTDYRLFVERDFVDSMRPERARFRTVRNIDAVNDEGPKAPRGTWIDPWEDEFIVVILGWVISMGFPEWQRVFDWKIGSTVARTNPASGWVRAQATPYRLILRETNTSPYVEDWRGAWALTQRIGQLTYADPNTWVPSDMTYLSYTRGALVYIDKLKAWNVSESLTWATGQLNTKKWKTPFKWRLGKGLD